MHVAPSTHRAIRSCSSAKNDRLNPETLFDDVTRSIGSKRGMRAMPSAMDTQAAGESHAEPLGTLVWKP